MLEILLLALYVPARIDKRFYVHDGSSKRKTYQKPEETHAEGEETEDDTDLEKRRPSLSGSI